jgi:hypothetical protein
MSALWFVDHKVVVYWVADIAPGPLPSYVTGLAPSSPGHCFCQLSLLVVLRAACFACCACCVLWFPLPTAHYPLPTAALLSAVVHCTAYCRLRLRLPTSPSAELNAPTAACGVKTQRLVLKKNNRPKSAFLCPFRRLMPVNRALKAARVPCALFSFAFCGWNWEGPGPGVMADGIWHVWCVVAFVISSSLVCQCPLCVRL